jgi:hypothetical protein
VCVCRGLTSSAGGALGTEEAEAEAEVEAEVELEVELEEGPEPVREVISVAGD